MTYCASYAVIAPNGRRYTNRMLFRRIEPPTLMRLRDAWVVMQAGNESG
jgi:hypothetical protein